MNELNRSEYGKFYPQTTRWHDNDIYGHINNVVYYSYFDTAVNRYLIEECGLDIHNAEVVGFVVASSCNYASPLAYPSELEIGIRVKKVGNKSVEYALAVFAKGAEQASAAGRLTHVFVNRASGLSVSIPAEIRQGLKQIEV